MRILKSLVLAAVCVVPFVGCSETTKQETREALDEAGDAIGAAAADTKENAKKAAAAVEKGAREVQESLDEDAPAQSAATDGDSP
jgi:uncharacterized protein (UPF0333 family)